ncbi:MAG: preprotein translocase subunit SecD [Halobacteria archaeon]|nr:preprotein translocase subunit SecD [Halobacteria archaeon]
MDFKRMATDWRIILLVVVVVLSVVALVPGPGAEGPTALSFGLELDGGTRLQLSPVGSQAEVTGIGTTPLALQSNLTEALGVPVRVIPSSQGSSSGIVEVRGNVSDTRIRQVLTSHGLQVQSISEGITFNTLQQLRDSIQTRLDEALGSGSGAQVTARRNAITQDNFIVVEVPGARRNASSIADIIRTQGRFQIQVLNEGNKTTVVYGDAIVNNQVTQPLRTQDPQRGPYYVQFELTDSGQETFARVLNNTGTLSNPNTHPLIMVFNDEEVFNGTMQPSLARSIQQGTWQGGLSVTGLNRSQANVVSISLRSGALPTPVEITSRTTISPVQGQEFKRNSLIVGLIAVLAVGATIFWRYRDVRIAVPMIFTGLAEVLALLGFAAVFNFNLDLSHVAGLIAVIGTGVDDLVIIADEVLERGEIKSSSLYEKRIKRAFIIIGMAAVTTIGAMAPLAYLGLGRISGFAIITIVGVLIGVLITRPAYGSILRELLTDN